MKIENFYFLFALSLILLLGIGSVAASNLDESGGIQSNASSIQLNDNLASVEDSHDILEDSNDVIIVEDWDDLKYYCSLNDKNYNLKLKEDTNYYPTNPASDNDQIVIKNNVTITGSSGAYIGDASPNARNISYAPIKVEDKSGIGIILQNITFKWISTSYQTDGVFLILGGNVNNTIRDCTFTNITTDMGHSSILHIKYGYLDVINCTFTNCTTDFGCISVYCPDDVPTDTCTGARMVVRDSYFSDNYAKTEPGCINNCGLLKVYNSTFYRNSAFWWAGAIHTHGGGNTSLYNSNFTDNVAGWNGGALYTYSYLQIYDCIFAGNNCTTNNGGGAIGACKYLHSPYIYIENSLFEDNANNCWGLDDLSTSGTGRGGAISLMDEGSIDVINTTFIHNSASMGSAIAIIAQGTYGSPDVTLIGNTFINNTRSGDVLYIYLSKTSKCEIRNNTFINSTIELSKLRIDSEDPIGNEITINIDTSIKNPSAYDSDILDKIGYDVYVDGVFYRNVMGKKFNYIFNDDEKHNIFIASSISSDVSNTISVSNKKEYIFLSKSGNDNNDGKSRTTPVKTLTKAIELARDTGNIYILDGTYSESNFNIGYDLVIKGENGVTLTGSGNNLFNITSGNVEFNNIIFSNIKQTIQNSRIISSNGKIIFENCKFIGGDCRYYGIDANEVSLTNTVFDNNQYYYYFINAPILSAENITVTNNRFYGSSTSYGFLYSNSVDSWNIIDSKFENNTNLRSGVLFIKGNSLSEANIENSVFKSNSLIYSTSTVYTSCILVGCNLHIDKTAFLDNKNLYDTSKPKSSVIYVDSQRPIDMVISNSIFANNTYGSGAEGVIYASATISKQITADYNWFGNNLNNLSAKPELNSNIKCNYWYSLNVSSNVDKLGPGENAIITFDLNHVVLKNGSVIQYSALELPEVSLSLSAVNGILDTYELLLEKAYVEVEFTKDGYDDAYVIGSYHACDARLNIAGTKNTPNLEIETSNITAGDDLEITVTISDDATGDAILNFNGTNYTLTFANGVAHKTIENVSEGNYVICVIYGGDYKYLARNVTEYVTANRLDSFITIEVADAYVGDDLEVLVKTVGDATGNITLNIWDRTLSQKITNGQVQFVISSLEAKDYIITASYGGNVRYAPSSNRSSVSILKYNSTIEISLSEIQLNTDLIITATVLNDSTGNVSFIINGNSNIIDVIGGKAIFTINDIAKGDYLIEAIYNGDEKYLPSSDSVQFSVGKLNSTLTVNVENIDYGQNATVEVTLNSDATGNVSVTVDDRTFTGTLSGGSALITVNGLTAGDKNLTVTFDGDENYLPSSNSSNFVVNKINPAFNVIADSVRVGNSVIVKINFNNDMRGNFTVKIGDNTFSRIISRYGTIQDLTVNDLLPDDYEVIVTYNGDNNYKTYSNTTTFSVFEYPEPQVSNEGQDTQNSHKSAYETISNGKVLFEIQLDSNITGSIVIDADGNIYFATADSVYSYDSNGEIRWNFVSSGVEGAFSGVSIGRDIILAPFSGDKLFFINITTGNTNTHSNMYWGSSIFSPVINDDYNVYITSEKQVADNKYYLVVIPYTMWESSSEPIVIGLDSIKPISAPIVQNGMAVIPNEEGLYIIDILNDDPANMPINNSIRPIFGIGNTIYVFDGNKLVAINNQQKIWETAVSGTVGNNLALDSDIGYLYSVNKEGALYEYDITNGEETLVYDLRQSVSSDLLIDNNGNIYLGTETGFFYALDSDGNVLWRANLNSPITGKPVMDETGLIYVVVNNSRIVALSNQERQDCQLDVKADNITVGEDAILNITFDKSASGTVTISIGDKVYDVLPTGNDGMLSVSISGLSYGNYSFEIKYSGDMRFIESSVKLNVSVSKEDIPVDNQTIVIPDVVDSSPTFSINLPEDATGNFTIYVDGKEYGTVALKDGKASISVENLASGSHKISIAYSGDDKYSAISKEVNINVPVIKIAGSDVAMLYTSGVAYKVRLTSDGIGLSGKTVVFNINGKAIKASTDKNGYASVKIDLPPKSTAYSITATYNGIKTSNKVKVNGIITAKNVKVKKSKKVNKIKVTLKKVNGKYLKSKKLTLKINGKKVTAKTNKKGVATFKVKKNIIKKLKAGKKYKYTVTYLKETVTKKITIKK